MVITRITGGLGNQLFQYAMGRRLAMHHRTELLVDASGYGANGEWRPEPLASFTRPFALSKLRIQARVATPGEIDRLRDDYFRATTRDRAVRQLRRIWPRFLRKESHMVERQFRFQPEALHYPNDVYLQGFWQSPHYFEDVSATIREEARLVDRSIEESAAGRVAVLKQRHGRVVSLHVRRGDLAHAVEVVGDPNLTYGAPVSTTYIERAMQEFPPDACFLVFSDTPKDIEWCRKHIHARHLEFSTAESDLWDFAAMQCCDDHIIANSTFSWWAAWLDPKASKRVVAPRVWSSPSYRVPMPTDDLLPESWTVL